MKEGVKPEGLDAVEGVLEDLSKATETQALLLSHSMGMKPKKRLNANDKHRIAAEAARRAERK